MPHIKLAEEMPGITAGFAFRPETANPMRELAHVLLHTSGNEGFSSADRELIASFVSSRNACYFCQTSHGAAAAYLQEGGEDVVKAVCTGLQIGTHFKEVERASRDCRASSDRRQTCHRGAYR